MIAHTGLPVSDYKKSKEFYIKVLAPLGYQNNMEYGEAAGFMEGGHTSFWIGKNDKGVIPLHVAFEAKNKEQVDEFYKVALAAGASDNGAPGYRTQYWVGYYATFVHDPDGHNVEVVWYDYSKEEKK
jgi:predicted lactoylglutathione lyase